MKKLVFGIFFCTFLFYNLFAPKQMTEYKSTIISTNLNVMKFKPFSMENLDAYLTLINADHKEIIIRQAILETGFFVSDLFKYNQNLFGMKMPKQRETTAISNRNGYAVYYHWTSSVDDYIVLQQIWKIKRLIFYNNGYLTLLLAKYAKDPNYIELLKQIKIPNYDRTSGTESSSIRD